MKIIAKFTGKVNVLNSPPTPSYATLTNSASGEVVQTQVVTSKLIEKGINYPGCEFEIEVLQADNGMISAVLTKIDPNAAANKADTWSI